VEASHYLNLFFSIQLFFQPFDLFLRQRFIFDCKMLSSEPKGLPPQGGRIFREVIDLELEPSSSIP
jgi:hypothetical protein